MKKIVLSLLLVLFMVAPCFAGLVLYDQKGIKVGVDELTPFAGYDFNYRNPNNGWVYGTKTSLIQWKILNLDVGLIGKIDEIDDNQEDDLLLDAIVGLSVDLPSPMSFKDNVYTSVGLFTGDKLGDLQLKKDTIRYGIFGGVTVKF